MRSTSPRRVRTWRWGAEVVFLSREQRAFRDAVGRIQLALLEEFGSDHEGKLKRLRMAESSPKLSEVERQAAALIRRSLVARLEAAGEL